MKNYIISSIFKTNSVKPGYSVQCDSAHLTGMLSTPPPLGGAVCQLLSMPWSCDDPPPVIYSTTQLTACGVLVSTRGAAEPELGAYSTGRLKI